MQCGNEIGGPLLRRKSARRRTSMQTCRLKATWNCKGEQEGKATPLVQAKRVKSDVTR